MKFKKVEPKVPWPVEKIEKRMAEILEDIRFYNRRINASIDIISEHKDKIRVASFRISNKQKYLNQLKAQLCAIKEDSRSEP